MRRQRLRDTFAAVIGRRLVGLVTVVGVFVLAGNLARLVLS